MSNAPATLKYTKSHEWVKDNGDGTVTVGITDHAQEALGDLVFVDLPQLGGVYDAGAECAVVESVKAASDIYAPLAGEVIKVNDDLASAPETINGSPYDDGWMFVLQLSDAGSLDGLLDADAYAALLEEEG